MKKTLNEKIWYGVFVHHSWDSDLYDRNIKIIYTNAFGNEPSLYEICEKLNVNPERFEASWKVEYIFD
ncbi:hypothetical protein C8Z91_24995 [Paenibacillus elgii]|uniref:Uncharacterized protein n=1 Tax=Paenibacillus elgii TaxID=189691 RepID=A0A2T6FXM4_9BACL|nr:hypothetical protein [Paenibacillus elgii]PUA36639.1 hypothetical protein C8Z91_24995 [Paenibacillus elgii]